MKTTRMRWSGLAGLWLLGLLALAPSAWAGDGWWTNWGVGSGGGYWTNAVNWTNAAGGSAVPDNGNANLVVTTGSYTVYYDAAAPAISNLFLRNGAGRQTTLVLSAPLAHMGGYINLSNAVVIVTNNGVWSYPGTNSTADRLMEIVGGAELVVNGGAVQFTNIERATASQRSYIYVGPSSTGTLRVASGRFDFFGTNSAPNGSHTLYVGRYAGGAGYVEIAPGATMTLGQGGGAGANLWPLFVGGIGGGRGAITVAGDLAFPYAGPYVGIAPDSGSYGEIVLTNSGRITGGGRWTFGAGGNSLGVLRLCGTNTMFGSGWEQLNIGYNSSALGCSTGLAEIVSGSIQVWGTLVVGLAENSITNAALGTLNVYGGDVTNQTLNGTWIGWARNGSSAEGTLTMTNGFMHIKSAKVIEYPPNRAPNYGLAVCGLTIGLNSLNNGTVDDTNPVTRAKGTLNLSGGHLRNDYQMAIGINGATGIVNQTGGAITHLTTDTNQMTYIGYGYGTNAYTGAGYGLYHLSGGTFATRQRVFVGGVPTNFQWYAKPGAIGLLKVTGGSFTASNTVYLGANGSGTMLIGSGGVVRCSDLVVSNNPMGKLQFDFGADGSVGQLIVTNRLTIAATAKLEVNVPTAYVAEGRKVFTLATFKTRDGTFADITITNYVPQPYVEQTPTNLLLHIPPRVAGITIMLR